MSENAQVRFSTDFKALTAPMNTIPIRCLKSCFTCFSPMWSKSRGNEAQVPLLEHTLFPGRHRHRPLPILVRMGPVPANQTSGDTVSAARSRQLL